MTNAKQRITIEIRDGIDPVDALQRVRQVINEGRVSKNGTMYCYGTTFTDGIKVHTRDYRKTDCFVVYKSNS